MSPTASLRTASRGLWPLLNALQLLFIAVWTSFWVALACVALLVSRNLPLVMARRLWAPGLLRAGGMRLAVRGRENIDREHPQVIASNHQSMVDIPVAFIAAPVNLRFILKRELAWVLPVGLFAWATRMVFVDRRHREGARRSLRRLQALGRAGGSIMSFPEGTRSRAGDILPFKKGVFVAAIEAQLPVVPMAITGADRVLPPRSFRFRPGLIQVAFGRPIPTAGLTLADRQALATEVREAVVALQASLRGEAATAG